MSELEISRVYRERARLISALSRLFPCVLAYSDPDNLTWPVLYVSTSAGQLSWHLHEDDLDLFEHVRWVAPDDPRARWDQHTTETKYQRLAEVMADAQLVRTSTTRDRGHT